MSTHTKPQDGRRKRRPGVEEQKSIITDAAIGLFIECGTRSTSIAQICARADVSKPTFYRCFKDKDALVSHLYQHSINTHVEQLLGFTMSTSDVGKSVISREHVNGALDDLFDRIFEHAALAQLLMREYSDPQSPASQIIDSTFEHIAKTIEKNLHSRREQRPSRTFLKAMMAAFQWIAYDAIKEGLTAKKKREAKLAARELSHAMMTQMGE